MRKGMFKHLFEEKPCTEQETRLLQASGRSRGRL